MNRLSSVVIALGLAAIGTALYLWLRPPAPEPAAAPEVSVAAASDTPPAASVPPAADPPAIQHPIESPQADAPPAAETPAAVAPVLENAALTLVGRQHALTFLHVDRLAHRVAATVDGLGRAHVAPAVWPVVPTPGRFAVTGDGDDMRIARENEARYAPFVAFATALDPDAVAALYRRFYPQFQLAYDNLGYPGRYFNDRLVAVIDLLLATPDRAGAPALRLVEVKGPIPSQRPWIRYEFVDPELESLSAGQKMLLRVGPAQRAALKQQLRALRARITAPASGAATRP